MNILNQNNSIRTCLWFDGKGLEAAKFYVSLIPGSELHTPDTGDGEPLLVSFALGGVPYQIINGGSHYKLSPACSIAVTTSDQDETDRIWDALVADGSLGRVMAGLSSGLAANAGCGRPRGRGTCADGLNGHEQNRHCRNEVRL